MLYPANKNMTIYCGKDWQQEIWIMDEDGNNVDMTGYSAKMQLRETEEYTSALIVEFSISWIDQTAGKLKASLTDTQTSAISQAVGFYDLTFTDSAGISLPWLIGQMDINGSPTEV